MSTVAEVLQREPVDQRRLPFRDMKHWRWRWLRLTRGGTSLHRIASLSGTQSKREEWPHCMPGVAVCGKSGEWSMPGVFSRMDAPLCRSCRRLLGIVTTHGHPYNAGEHERYCERQTEAGRLAIEEQLRSAAAAEEGAATRTDLQGIDPHEM